jgi:hypothetical protein
LLRSFDDGLRHAINVAVHAVEDNLNFDAHGCSILSKARTGNSFDDEFTRDRGERVPAIAPGSQAALKRANALDAAIA